MIATINKAYVRLYTDSQQVTAYVEWTNAKGKTGRTEGKPSGAHMKALLARAKREGVKVTAERW